MITTIEVPHLAKGQKVAEYKKIYLASTATLKDEQKLACLPLYIHRSEGERQLAFTATKEENVNAAFTFLEELIDGAPCKFTESDKFFNLLPCNTSMDGLRSYYFQLSEIAVRAEIPSDVFIMRFLTNAPGGKRVFKEYKDTVKAGLDVAGMTAFFKIIMEKLDRNSAQVSELSDNKEESFTFPVFNEETMPGWAKDLQKEVGAMRQKMASNESGFGEGDLCEEDQVFAFYNNDKKHSSNSMGKSKPKCHICGKLGHIQRNCYQRICGSCKGKGHDAEVCPSKKNFDQKKFSNSGGKR